MFSFGVDRVGGTAGSIRAETVPDGKRTRWSRRLPVPGPADLRLNAAMDPSINFGDLAEIRKIWPNKIAIKGVQNVEDAKRLADLGVDAIVLSNHGGRQKRSTISSRRVFGVPPCR
jgi:isopentenyl diphosphate isomerase/L-lactate dehydrogenase-like FMN-dependent dehydrogenase